MSIELPPPDVEMPESAQSTMELLENNRVVWVVSRGQETLERYTKARQAMANLDFVLEQALACGYFPRGSVTPDGDFMPEGSLTGSADEICREIADLNEIEGKTHSRT